MDAPFLAERDEDQHDVRGKIKRKETGMIISDVRKTGKHYGNREMQLFKGGSCRKEERRVWRSLILIWFR